MRGANVCLGFLLATGLACGPSGSVSPEVSPFRSQLDDQSIEWLGSHPFQPNLVSPAFWGEPYGLTQREPFINTGFPINPPGASFVDAFPTLQNGPRAKPFHAPIFILATPGDKIDDRLFVVSQSGVVSVFPNRENVRADEVSNFLDISKQGDFVWQGESGLLGMAFDPDYHQNGYLYIYYTANNPFRTVIDRYQVSSLDKNKANPASRQLIFQELQPMSNHNGGMIAFGPKKMLFVGLGDGGGGGDPGHMAQRLTRVLGSIIRINPSREVKASPPYTIPRDNPHYLTDNGVMDFKTGKCFGVNGYCAEIWASGIRNPWRFSIDEKTNTVWIGDVGQGTREEINRFSLDRDQSGKLKPLNGGWPCVEGKHVHPKKTFENHRYKKELEAICFDPKFSPDPPIHDYDRNQGTVAMGGYLYRGSKVTKLKDKYVFGDYGRNVIWGGFPTSLGLANKTALRFIPQLVSFGEDQNQELYAVSLGGYANPGGRIYKAKDPTGGKPVPKFLSKTQLFKTPLLIKKNGKMVLNVVDGLVPYEVTAPLWSDGAEKSRWIGIPSYYYITFDPKKPWQFPEGTTIVKHFELKKASASNDPYRRLETRVLIKGKADWHGYGYRWIYNQNTQGVDAELVSGGFIQDDIDIGSNQKRKWYFPGLNDCTQCHTSAAGFVLGVRTHQLNSNKYFQSSNVTDNQLRTWNHIGLFLQDIEPTFNATRNDFRTHYEWFANPYDFGGEGTQDKKARSYLAANCAYCHQPNGPTPVKNMDLRFTVAEKDMGIIEVSPTHGSFGVKNAKRLAMGEKERSMLWHRMKERENKAQMPPVGTFLTDFTAKNVLGWWADASTRPGSVEYLGKTCAPGRTEKPYIQSYRPVMGEVLKIFGYKAPKSANGLIWLSFSSNFQGKFKGCDIRVHPGNTIPFAHVKTDSNGKWSHSFLFPRASNLLGLKVVIQASFEAKNTNGFEMTNAARLTIGNPEN